MSGVSSDWYMVLSWVALGVFWLTFITDWYRGKKNHAGELAILALSFALYVVSLAKQ